MAHASLTSLTRTYPNTCPPCDPSTITERREGAFTIRPVLVSEASQFGAEVYGVDWSRAVPEDVVNQVR
jgi:alpha-ketoglutarate-dependent 2,4-dichlorophenoxyacetate dioxygenase